MRFPSLVLTCHSVEHLRSLNDDESASGVSPVLIVGWALHLSERAGLILGVLLVERRMV